MKTIMVDMDNVITDGVFLDLVNEFLGTNYQLNELKDYYIQGLLGEKDEKFWKWVEDKNFYEKAVLLDGCYEVLKKVK